MTVLSQTSEWLCIYVLSVSILFDFLVLNATFSNISAISWRPVLVVEEAREPGDNYRPWATTGKLYNLWLRVECTLFVIYKAGREPTPYWSSTRKHAIKNLRFNKSEMISLLIQLNTVFFSFVFF